MGGVKHADHKRSLESVQDIVAELHDQWWFIDAQPWAWLPPQPCSACGGPCQWWPYAPCAYDDDEYFGDEYSASVVSAPLTYRLQA